MPKSCGQCALHCSPSALHSQSIIVSSLNPLQSKEGQPAEEGEEGEEKKPKEHRKKRKGSKKHHRRDADKDGKWHSENILYACLERMTTKQQPF